MPDENLSNLGYSSEQIAVLRNFNGSEDDLQLLSASGTMEVSIHNVKYWPSLDETQASVDFGYYWSGVPVFKTTDVLVLSYNDWHIDSLSNLRLHYEAITGSGNTSSGYGDELDTGGLSTDGFAFSIPMTKNDNYYWAQSGEGSIGLMKYGKDDLEVYGALGHSKITFTPTVFIPGYANITFGYDTVLEDSARDSMDHTVIAR